MVEKKIASIIQILDQYTVIIDTGYKKGLVRKGTELAIYEEGPSIKDLNGDNLGTYDFIKSKLTVTECFEKFSICKHAVKEDNSSFTRTISPLLTSKTITYKKMNVDESEISPLTMKEPRIKLGDPVKKLNTI